MSSAKNAYAIQQRQKMKRAMDVQRRFTIQQSADVAVIVLNECFGFGKKRCVEFLEMFQKEMNEFIMFALEDDQCDKELNYTKGKMDELLGKILGEFFVKFEERYPKEVK